MGKWSTSKNRDGVVTRMQFINNWSHLLINLLSQIHATIIFVLAKTRITIPPKSVKVHIASRVDLRCEAEADESLTLRYYWIKDGERLESNEKIEWRESRKVLTIADMTVFDSGVYTCVAFTPDPQKSEDRASAVIDIIGKLAFLLFSGCFADYCCHLLPFEFRDQYEL